ncbi:MAG: hypothetical protein K6360_02610 [Deltaproteobacteria bacterium]
MRTTIEIEDDILEAARELARLERVSVGRIVSRLLRQGLTGLSQGKAREDAGGQPVGGFRPFPSRGRLVSNDLVNDIRDREGV